ncbi:MULTISPECIES: type II toxin-antitoxin system tRNA(fMet)-specific endonuclease VapC [unclassified Tolypothrix]|uniref:type II toxin-antitoxin system tRNA(fMet)-specific endonuclease VapC n=1 Tax=unclassified Tolypothrix TaxID=2649714 RepID=UPI0005EAA4E4|nr:MULTISPECIES: type II toxin-antitoxin system VapC family toxin [unclassified Tolypothrix]BAY90813.1 PIN domain protein [Microchaete diplosiphon NIES-3275]EKF04336.1 toxin-antitoxin system, toxin component, PIN family [Tolypothrix sp. PCC 7601]MBE9085448.1 type II toxin-antitoxin system VapC family toxin [Tolypothrix sp. LEGE 11397]UYD24943.1 type II toxin-antitoxin system VapC family toxin [Tolypothrix sp. PCC 7712]UYD32824.1 type II toxin-antitoxin system VapC family toxin [Tolypothrix sp.
MAYLLDTNACIQILNSANSPVTQKILSIPSQDIYLCTVVYSELYYGAYKSANVNRNLSHLENLFAEFAVLPLDIQAAKIAGNIRANLNALGTPIGANDLLIAAIALANDLTLVTHNTREFSRIDGLKYEDWE